MQVKDLHYQLRTHSYGFLRMNQQIYKKKLNALESELANWVVYKCNLDGASLNLIGFLISVTFVNSLFLASWTLIVITVYY